MTDDRNDSAARPAVPRENRGARGPQQSADLGETALNQSTPSGVDRAPDRDPAPAAWIGRTLGKYRITGVLGRGGMGLVLRAHDPLIERDVALKLLPADLAEDDTARNRFLAEAKAAGKLNHPHVVAIHEIGQDDRRWFLVMETRSTAIRTPLSSARCGPPA
ncbi:MAG: protein kinase [Planctomycetales bacterium]